MDTPFPPDARVENEVATLRQAGHEIFLFHIDYEGRPRQEEYQGIRIFRMNGSWLLYKLSALVYTLPFFRWKVQRPVKHFIRESGVEVLHIQDMVIAEAVFRVNREFSLPVVLDLHENRPEIMKLYKHVNQWPGRWLIHPARWSEKQIEFMEKADHVILVTEEAREWAFEEANIPKEKVTVLPNVVRLNEFKVKNTDPLIYDLSEDRFTVLYIGDTSLRRGTSTAIEAIAELRDRIPNIQLLLVGSSSQDHLLRQKTKKHQLESWVRFEGWQDPEKLPAYIHASQVGISPLHRNLHHDTTYANKLFQYMAIGRPVIVSDCPAQAQVVQKEQCGLVHEAGNERDLADKILTLYENPVLRKQMGEKGRKAIKETYHWESTGKALIRLYNQIQRTHGYGIEG